MGYRPILLGHCFRNEAQWIDFQVSKKKKWDLLDVSSSYPSDSSVFWKYPRRRYLPNQCLLYCLSRMIVRLWPWSLRYMHPGGACSKIQGANVLQITLFCLVSKKNQFSQPSSFAFASDLKVDTCAQISFFVLISLVSTYWVTFSGQQFL